MQIHLVRHGEVDNPNGVVYADIPGFSLSGRGRAQAAAAGAHLSACRPLRIVSSPLDRAVATAEVIAAETGATVTVDKRLTEWDLGVRWRGATWNRLPVVFPGEVEAYLTDPTDLPFCPEPLERLATRVSQAIEEWSATAREDLVFVSHEDPLHAARLRLIGTTPAAFHEAKPEHGCVITLTRTGSRWQTVARWAPVPMS
jgi:broad specificity phosphatase PhoE